MNLQYISDNKGKTTGVFIPISDWNELKSKYKEIEEIDVPDWQRKEVLTRLADYEKDPSIAQDFNEAMDELDREEIKSYLITA